MFYINTLNPLSNKGLSLFSQSDYALNQAEPPDALLLRSADLHQYELPQSVQLVARAGAGTNNIPIQKMTDLGIPVLNTPGANANAVKELVLTGLLLASRHVVRAWDFCRQLTGDEQQQHHAVESQKKTFTGSELLGKTLAVVGLGAIGVKVANSARQLGMNVVGYDPAISVKNAWKLRASVLCAETLVQAVEKADYVTVHVPLLSQTQSLMSAEVINAMKPGAVLLNFARSGIVDVQAVTQALQHEQLNYYVCDFPLPELTTHPRVICLPHLGASTQEAQENCAVMAVEQVKAFFEHGHVSNSVNFPEVKMQHASKFRLALVNHNVPNMVAQITSLLSERHLNIANMTNRSRDDVAYTLIDLEQSCDATVMEQLRNIPGVMRVRLIDRSVER